MTDREIDALVAQHIMGERVVWTNKAWSMEDWLISDRPTEYSTMAIKTDENWKPGASYPEFVVIPHYSTDMNEAWQVVGHFKKPLWTFTLYLSRDTYTADFAEWEDESALGDKRKGAARDTCASRAICLAALQAVGVEV